MQYIILPRTAQLGSQLLATLWVPYYFGVEPDSVIDVLMQMVGFLSREDRANDFSNNHHQVVRDSVARAIPNWVSA